MDRANIPQGCDALTIQQESVADCIVEALLDVEFRVAVRTRIIERLSSESDQETEGAALTLLALRHSVGNPTHLLRRQHRSGAWGARPGIDLPNAYHTALALLAIHPCRDSRVRTATDRAFAWLAELRGQESHWLWRWKFRWFDRQVRFDPSKSGWPWVPGTVSWVAPTALTILAFGAWRRESSRVAAGREMLLDRACPRGGWNAGNSEVFGVELDPHPDFTAMALLALRHSAHGQEGIIQPSLDYLAERLNASLSPYSLAWAAIALSAYSHEGAGRLRGRLEASAASRLAVLPSHVLALTALALEQPPFNFREVDR